MSVPDVSKFSVRELLAIYSNVMNALRQKDVIRTENNPTGDYAEWLVSQKLNLSLEKSSAAGHDAVDSDGKKYQIKGRRLTSRNKSTQLGIIRNLENKDFDFLVAVIFEENWDVCYSAKIPHDAIKELAYNNDYQNGCILNLTKNIIVNNAQLDITHLLQD